MVRHVETLEQFQGILKDAKDKLVVVDFTASWCGPCKQIGPEFEKLAGLAENKDVIFLKVDVDDAPEVAEECGITGVPTFIFFRNRLEAHRFSGANKKGLTAAVESFRT